MAAFESVKRQREAQALPAEIYSLLIRAAQQNLRKVRKVYHG
jgi:hypothetical protein